MQSAARYIRSGGLAQPGGEHLVVFALVVGVLPELADELLANLLGVLGALLALLVQCLLLGLPLLQPQINSMFGLTA